MFDLTGKTALITGATGGIGASIAKALHGAGATIAISGTRSAVLEELKAALGGRVHVLPCNLSDAADVEKLVPAAETAMGGIDILVNNAGITKDGLAMRMKDEDWAAVLDVNLTASFRLCRAAMRPMMKKRWGRIVNITSIVGVTGNPGQANYVASKAGIIGLTRELASQWGRYGIRVNAVAPGFFASEMTAELGDDPEAFPEFLLARTPLHRGGRAGELDEAVLFLLGAGSSFVTGHVLSVDGGMSVR